MASLDGKLKKWVPEGHQEDAIRRAFGVFDTDESGMLSADELKAIFTRTTGSGQELTEEQTAELIDEFDTDGDGFLDLEEFVQLFMSRVITKPAPDKISASGAAITSVNVKISVFP